MGHAGWSSQVARRAHDPEVPGPNPGPATENAAASARFPYRCMTAGAARGAATSGCGARPGTRDYAWFTRAVLILRRPLTGPSRTRGAGGSGRCPAPGLPGDIPGTP